jgi:uncharacterized protein (TIGR02271 family)
MQAAATAATRSPQVRKTDPAEAPDNHVFNRRLIMENTVVGVYDNKSQAQSAMNDLLASGFSRNDVQMNPEHMPTTASADTTGDTGHGIGHFFRSLFGMDDTDKSADIYSEAVRRGSAVLVVTVATDDERDRAMDVMNRYDPIDIDERSTHWRSQGWSGFDTSAPRLTDDEILQERSKYAAAAAPVSAAASKVRTEAQAKIPVVQEELKVGKREVQRGGVRVFQRVRETPVTENVQLREEHVKVERRPVDQPATEADLAAFKEGSVEMREMAEEPVVEKTARVVEEVVVGKEVTQETASVNETVRSTEVEIQALSPEDDADYRRHWKTAYSSLGGRYEDYDSAYSYGTQLAGTDRYRNARWEDVEPDVRRDWESRNPGSTWDKFKDAIRYAMDRVKSAVKPGDDDTDYRSHWKTAYGSSGGRYEEYDDAYRYGSKLSGTERFKNYRWDDVEPDVRRDWEANHPGSTWDKVKDAVRYGAERVTGGGTRH